MTVEFLWEGEQYGEEGGGVGSSRGEFSGIHEADEIWEKSQQRPIAKLCVDWLEQLSKFLCFVTSLFGNV